MKRLSFLAVILCLAFSSSFAQTQDTVNGWYFLKTDKPGAFSAYTRIVSDTAKEGTKSQLFGYRTLNHLNGVYFEKKLDSTYKTPEWFSIYVLLNKIEPARILNTATFQFFLGNKDTMVAIERGGRGFGEEGQWGTDFQFLAFPQATDSVDRMWLRFAFVTIDMASAEFLFDKLVFVYDKKMPLDSTLLVDRFGDKNSVALAPIFSASPAALDFDTVKIGSAKTDSALVRNTGTDTLRISSAVSTSSEFIVGPMLSAIPPGASARIRVTFRPNALGTRNGFIVFGHNAVGSPDTISVSGVGRDLTDVVDDYSLPPTHYSLLTTHYSRTIQTRSTPRQRFPSRWRKTPS